MKEPAKVLDLREVIGNHRWAVVGDIHGCLDTFFELLNQIEWSSSDILISTGDLIDRGPSSMGVLAYFMSRQSTHFVVEGNHEYKLKRAIQGHAVKAGRGLAGTLATLDEMSKPLILGYLERLPQVIRVPDAEGIPQYVIHAGIDPGMPIEQQEAEVCRFVRYLGGHNYLDYDHGQPWYDGLRGRQGKIIFGHHVHPKITPNRWAVALDGGCCVGGELRAMVCEAGKTRIEVVASHFDYRKPASPTTIRA